MKGVIFTEFTEMVENTFGFDTLDEIIERSDLPSGGTYTAVGTYDHQEIVSLVMNLAEVSETPVPDLMQVFGEHLFSRFTVLYPDFFNDPKDGFDFLESVENYIHVEVRKLYPGADLPSFDCERNGDHELKMIYKSGKHMEDVAEGLIRGCLKHYKEDATVTRDDGDSSEEGVTFTIKRTI